MPVLISDAKAWNGFNALLLPVCNMSAVTGDVVYQFLLLNRGLIPYFRRDMLCNWKDRRCAASKSSTNVCALTSLLVLRRTGIRKGT